MDETHSAFPEHPDRGRQRYWARLVKLLRDPWPPRTSLPNRTPDPSRTSEPPRQPAPARLDE